MRGGRAHPSALDDRGSSGILNGRVKVTDLSDRPRVARCSEGALRKLPALWTHRTRPQVLGNHKTASTTFHRASFLS